MWFRGGWAGCCVATLAIPLIFVVGAVVAVTIGPYVLLAFLGLCCAIVIAKIILAIQKPLQTRNTKRNATKEFQERMKRQMQIRTNMQRIQSKVRGEI